MWGGEWGSRGRGIRAWVMEKGRGGTHSLELGYTILRGDCKAGPKKGVCPGDVIQYVSL